MASISELLERFPNGFAVTPMGQIFEVINSTKNLADLYEFDLTESNGGFLVVAMPQFRKGDEKFVPQKKQMSEVEMREFLKKGRPV